jgi:hypothetical protein
MEVGNMPRLCSNFAVQLTYSLKRAMAYYTWIGIISTGSHATGIGIFVYFSVNIGYPCHISLELLEQTLTYY